MGTREYAIKPTIPEEPQRRARRSTKNGFFGHNIPRGNGSEGELSVSYVRKGGVNSAH